MNTNNFYTLTDYLGIKTNQQLQGFVDTFLAKYNVLDLTGFKLKEMQLDFTFEQIQKELNMNVMASYTAIQSEPIPIGTQGFSVSTGSIPRQKMRETMDEIKLREMYLLQDRKSVSSNRAMMAAADNLFVTLDNLVGGHANAMTYQRNQIVSTGGFVTTDTNNPQGLKNYKYSANIPTSNVVSLSGTSRWWTDKGTYKTEGSACDPIADLTALVEDAENIGVTAKHFEIDELYAKRILKHKKVIEAIAVNQYPMAKDVAMASSAILNISWKNRLEILGNIVGAPFKVIDHIATVQKLASDKTHLENIQMRSFATDVIVLVPDGNIGQVLSVEPLKLSGGLYAERMGGRLLINVTHDYQRKIQSFDTELTALCALDKPKYMFYLYPSGK